MNENMQNEIKAVQTEMEEEVRRKQGLFHDNEDLTSKIAELKDMFSKAGESLEKTLGKSDSDMEKLEEQLRTKIEAETTKLVVCRNMHMDRMTKKARRRGKMRPYRKVLQISREYWKIIQSNLRNTRKRSRRLTTSSTDTRLS